MLFSNRKEAGILLADKLASLPIDKLNTVVLAIPRGGLPVGYQIAKRFNLPLEIMLVKKLGAPHYPELAVATVSEDNDIIFNLQLLTELGMNTKSIDHVRELALIKLQEIASVLRNGHPPLMLRAKNIILVDDGIDTGATMEAVIQILNKRKVASITIASPVASAETLEHLYKKVQRVVVLSTPHPLYTVGEWYEDFTQVETEEAVKLFEENTRQQHLIRSHDNEQLR